MHRPSRRWIASLLTLACTLAGAAYPDKPVTLVVPFATGGSSDNLARSLAPLLAEQLRQPVVIENQGGAGGVVGTQRVVRANADGYTVLVGSGSEVLINKIINPALPYDGQRDLIPVTFVATGPMVLVGRTTLPAANVRQLLDLAAARPGSLSYASAGNGTPMHVAGESLKMRARISLTHVPYRGSAPALVDVMGGQVDLAVATLSAAQPHIRTGRLRAFAVTSPRPSELAPDIAALGQERGLEGFDLGVWFGLFVPARTPAAAIQRLQQAAEQVLANPDLRRRLAEQGLSAAGGSTDLLREFMAREVEKYTPVIRAANIKPE